MVYVIDRDAPNINTQCAKLVKEDPAYYWGTGIVNKLLPFDSSSSYITWQTLTKWLSDVSDLGYTIKTDLTHMKPYSDIYIEG